jgi:hypothetical protein
VSSGPAGARASASSTDNLSVLSRIAGIIRRPRTTLEAAVASPRWAGLLTVLFAVSIVVSAAFYVTPVGRQALVDQWERSAIAFGQPVDDARYAEFQELSGHGVGYAAVTALVTGPGATLALSAVVFGVFRLLRRTRVSFRQVLAIVVHASVILTLRQVIAAPINYARESIASPAALTLFLSMLDEGSPAARFFGLIDLFMIWWLVILAIGASVLYGGRTRTYAVQFSGVYVSVALLLAGAMAWLGGVS